jgi:hypothetical protein
LKIASLQGVFPFELPHDSFLFNYLLDSDLHKNSTSFTPLTTDSLNQAESDSLEGAFSVFCNGVNDEQAKKFIF